VNLAPTRLRWQLALVVGLSALGSTAVILGCLIAYYWNSPDPVPAIPSPEYDIAMAAVNENRALTGEQVALIRKTWEELNTLQGELPILAFFSLIGSLFGAATGLWIGSRLSKPIESVAAAADLVAKGDLTARADAKEGYGATAALVKNFNVLANGLFEAERELVATSSAIAHELRTPATVLKVRLEAIRDGVLESTEKELAGLIAQVDLLGAIANDMQTLSLAGIGELNLHRIQTDLADEVRLALDSLEGTLAMASIKVETKLDPAPAFADSNRIRQIINALVDNFKRYAIDGRSIRFETAPQVGYSRVVVMDRGPGLPNGAEKFVFDRFWRAEVSRSRETGGTGLGLSVVMAIAQAHGGTALAYDRPGGGAVFEIRFPSQPPPDLRASTAAMSAKSTWL
jgi:signal transduction histidine kinase